ncbi:hypothetical protein [Streptomyces sp. NPDC006551]|uniref:hypothetical protein n=1 Tax=Streptomyces sp. NPDC006551 TaxID=3157178 RepID=UPI0033A866E4
MPVDPFAVLNALLRAEAAREERTARVTEPEPERAPVRETPAAPAGKERRATR